MYFYSTVCTRTKLPEHYLNLHQVKRQKDSVTICSFQWCFYHWDWVGRGLLNKGLYGEVPPRDGPNPLPFCIPFLKERYPICIRSIAKWYPSHIPKSLKQQCFCHFLATFNTMKMIQSWRALSIHFNQLNDIISYPFLYCNQ